MSSLSKIAISGTVVRNPEKRFTGNNLAITTFSINIGTDSEEKIVRISAIGKLAETVAETVTKSSRVMIEGRLQAGIVKTQSGEERKILEITAQAVELISAGTAIASSKADSTDDFDGGINFDDELPADELIGEDEIPF